MSVEKEESSFLVDLARFGVEYSRKLLISVRVRRLATIARREPLIRQREG